MKQTLEGLKAKILRRQTSSLTLKKRHTGSIASYRHRLSVAGSVRHSKGKDGHLLQVYQAKGLPSMGQSLGLSG